MIGLDTNVLVQFFSIDDPEQGRKALEMMKSLTAGEPGWVGLVVLVDLVSELTRLRKLKRTEVFEILDKLLSSKEIVVEKSEIVLQALTLYRKTNIGFADCLIALSARAAGCEKTFTFDHNAARDAGMELLS